MINKNGLGLPKPLSRKTPFYRVAPVDGTAERICLLPAFI
ncbi:hypothetical protein CAter282_3506 [Collimonas arenae]|uniref:Uncharacterized protein n=1 Tax=Collimonas arenae TaxID=279058 RepID=A0A127PU35_9BURK|nr:hypothetical protein CAter10_3840 [Collimonas arenae]AMP11191.1 hypothetical protein CAter282_3506 [Collimonas arenae]